MTHTLPAWLSAVLLPSARGHIDPNLFAFPLGSALSAAALALLYVAEREWGTRPWMRLLRGPHTARLLLSLLTMGCLAGGCLSTDASFATSWPFITLWTALMVHLSLLLIHRLRHIRWRHDAAFLCVHGGLWLALLGGTTGAGDTRELRISVTQDRPTDTAFTTQGRMQKLPYTLQLQAFHTGYAQDGAPTRYAATLLWNNTPIEVAVNAPYPLRWDESLYLMGFAPQNRTAPTACTLQLIRQPWQYVILAGLLLMLAGVARMMCTLK